VLRLTRLWKKKTHIGSIGKVSNNTREGENICDSEPCRPWRPAEVLVSVDIELYERNMVLAGLLLPRLLYRAAPAEILPRRGETKMSPSRDSRILYRGRSADRSCQEEYVRLYLTRPGSSWRAIRGQLEFQHSTCPCLTLDVTMATSHPGECSAHSGCWTLAVSRPCRRCRQRGAVEGVSGRGRSHHRPLTNFIVTDKQLYLCSYTFIPPTLQYRIFPCFSTHSLHLSRFHVESVLSSLDTQTLLSQSSECN